MSQRWKRVTIPARGICCVIIVLNGIVTRDSAPVFRWAYGKEWAYVERWIKGKGGTIERIGKEQREAMRAMAGVSGCLW